GATVYLEGHARGTAPLMASGLESGRSYAVRAALGGYADAEQLAVASGGDNVLRLRLAPRPAAISIESEPPGAHILIDGKDSGKVTPAALDLPPGRVAQVTLDQSGYATHKMTVKAPEPGERAVYHEVLTLSPDVATLTIEAPEEAKVSVDGLQLV